MTGVTGKAYVSATTASGRLVRAPNWTDGLGVARWRGDGGGVRRSGGGCGGCRVGGRRRLQLYYDDRYQTKLKPNDYNNTRRRLCVCYTHTTDRCGPVSGGYVAATSEVLRVDLNVGHLRCSGYRLLQYAYRFVYYPYIISSPIRYRVLIVL